MNYTKFGEYFKILRIKNHEILNDAKGFLGVSNAFISSVECGKKPIPAEWFAKISNHYNLDEKEKNELQKAIDLSQRNINIKLTNVSMNKKNVAVQFQRSFDDMNDETAKNIYKILERKK